MLAQLIGPSVCWAEIRDLIDDRAGVTYACQRPELGCRDRVLCNNRCEGRGDPEFTGPDGCLTLRLCSAQAVHTALGFDTAVPQVCTHPGRRDRVFIVGIGDEAGVGERLARLHLGWLRDARDDTKFVYERLGRGLAAASHQQ